MIHNNIAWFRYHKWHHRYRSSNWFPERLYFDTPVFDHRKSSYSWQEPNGIVTRL